MHYNNIAYVVGNSWQLQLLSESDKKRLDSESWVLCCNRFLSNWRQIGFRPTVWVYGDTGPGKNITQEQINGFFRQELQTIQDDKELQERLRHIFICIENTAAWDILAEYSLPVKPTIYTRNDWSDITQVPAENCETKLFHYGGTLADTINIAHILSGGMIKITGCQYMTRWGHFYDEPETDEEMLPVVMPEFANRLWIGLSMMRDAGIKIVDCNFEHGKPIPEKYRIKSGLLF